MRTPSFLIALGAAALLAACQTPGKQSGNINDLPNTNPTATSTDLATGAAARE